MMRGIGRNLLSVAVVIVLLFLTFCGCAGSRTVLMASAEASDPAAENAESSEASSPEEQQGEEIELLDPVGAALRYETVEFREIAKVSTYPGVVCLDTVEYSYDSSQSFGNYAALPGDTVADGDPLFFGNADSLDDSIEAIEEENSSLLISFTDASSDHITDLSAAKKKEYDAAYAYQNYCGFAPEEGAPGYDMWAKGAMPLEKAAKQATMAREKLEQAYLERRELFDLEYAYNEKRISRLNEKKQDSTATASGDGVVVAVNYYYAGDQVPLGSNIMAVGDPSKMEIRCDYVSKSIINQAVEYYAIVDGKRYSVQYENMEPEEYRRLKQQNDEVYSTFIVDEKEGSISPGQYAVIVVVEKKTENALCVPKGAVSKDDSGSYVYLYSNGDSVYTPVQTGVSDSGFIEITYGLHDGDAVVYDAPYDLGTKTETIKKGDISVHFSSDGYLFYPTAEWLVNPAKNGTCYLTELLVERFEQIEEGQVLARIEVVTDKTAVNRINRKIDRQNARLADLQAKRAETRNEDELLVIDRAIRDRTRSIEDLGRQKEKLNRYSGFIEITSPYNGIVLDVSQLKDGSLIDYRERLVQIADDRSSFIAVDDKGGQLSYGDAAEVTFKDRNGKASHAEGTVVTMNLRGLSKAMNTGYALVRVPYEDIAAMTGEGSEQSNGYWSRSRFSVDSDVQTMHNVLLIPKSSTQQIGDSTYVVVRNEDGTSKLVRFVAGGGDAGNYWVAYGDITEGMEICWG